MARLPSDVEPFVFPPIQASPDDMVSKHLIEAILSCDGLVYVDGGYSAQSFWVAFERDYALRAKKSVFAFDPHTGLLRQDANPAMDLLLFTCYAQEIKNRVEDIAGFLMRQRFFSCEDQFYAALELLSSPLGGGGFDLDLAMRAQLTTRDKQIWNGGYVVLFWSKETPSSRLPQLFWEGTLRDHPDRLLVGLLDTTPLEGDLSQLPRNGQVIQLFGDQERPQMHRIDDLIVRLYWLIYRNTRQNQLS